MIKNPDPVDRRLRRALDVAVLSAAGAKSLAARIDQGPVPAHAGSTDHRAFFLWVAYGLSKGDWILTLANAVGATLSGSVLIFKVRDILHN
jgi:hypothetical protein